MAGAVDEASVSRQLSSMPKPQHLHSINLRYVSQQSVRSGATLSFARRIHLLLALETAIACWPRTFWAITTIDLRIRVAELDCDISLQLILESYSLHSRYCLHNRTLAVCHVTDGTDVDGRLSSNDFG